MFYFECFFLLFVFFILTINISITPWRHTRTQTHTLGKGWSFPFLLNVEINSIPGHFWAPASLSGLVQEPLAHLLTTHTRRPKHNTLHHVVIMSAQKRHPLAAARSLSYKWSCFSLLHQRCFVFLKSIRELHKTPQRILCKDGKWDGCVNRCCLGDLGFWMDLQQNRADWRKKQYFFSQL